MRNKLRMYLQRQCHVYQIAMECVVEPMEFQMNVVSVTDLVFYLETVIAQEEKKTVKVSAVVILVQMSVVYVMGPECHLMLATVMEVLQTATEFVEVVQLQTNVKSAMDQEFPHMNVIAFKK